MSEQEKKSETLEHLRKSYNLLYKGFLILLGTSAIAVITDLVVLIKILLK